MTKISKYNFLYVIGLPLLFIALFVLGVVIGNQVIGVIGIIGVILVIILFKSIGDLFKKQFLKKLAKYNFVPDNVFHGNSETIAIDNQEKKLALTFKYNPGKTFIVPLSSVKNATVKDFKAGAGFMEGTNRVAFEFFIDNKNYRVYTFFANKRRFKMDSEEVLKGISKAQLFAELLSQGKE